MEKTRSSETSAYSKPTRRHIPQNGTLHCHRRENRKSCSVSWFQKRSWNRCSVVSWHSAAVGVRIFSLVPLCWYHCLSEVWLVSSYSLHSQTCPLTFCCSWGRIFSFCLPCSKERYEHFKIKSLSKLWVCITGFGGTRPLSSALRAAVSRQHMKSRDVCSWRVCCLSSVQCGCYETAIATARKAQQLAPECLRTWRWPGSPKHIAQWGIFKNYLILKCSYYCMMDGKQDCLIINLECWE
jgi:hypothetical protein